MRGPRCWSHFSIGRGPALMRHAGSRFGSLSYASAGMLLGAAERRWYSPASRCDLVVRCVETATALAEVRSYKDRGRLCSRALQ